MVLSSKFLIILQPLKKLRNFLRVNQTPLQDSKFLTPSHHRAELRYCSCLDSFRIKLQHARLDRNRMFQTSNLTAKFSPDRIFQQLSIYSKGRIKIFSSSGTQENPVMIQRILDLTRILTWSRNFLQAWRPNLQPPLKIEGQPPIILVQMTM